MLSTRTLKLLYKIHKWLGLVVVLGLALQALSGTMVVFKHELGGVLQPHALRYHGAPVEDFFLDRIVASARDTGADRPLDRVVFPTSAGEAVLVRQHGRPGELPWIVTTTPDGKVLAAGSLLHFPLEAADRFHQTWLLGQAGPWLIGALGSSLLVMLISGAILWWPPRRAWRHAFQIHWRGALRVVVFDLHRVPGAIFLPMLTLLVVTGIAMAWRPLTTSAVQAFTPLVTSPPLVASGAVDARAWLSLDETLSRARKAFPGLPVRDVRFLQSERVLGVILNEPRAGRPRAVSQFWIDRASGAVLWRHAWADQTVGNESLDWILPIHSGEWLGTAGRALLLVTGVVLLASLITGVWMWLQRRRLRLARRAL